MLGHSASAKGVEVHPRKIEKIVNAPIPRTNKMLRSFLGLCSFYRRYVRRFANFAAPMHQLTANSCKFSWSQEVNASFELLRKLLAAPQILDFPREDR